MKWVERTYLVLSVREKLVFDKQSIARDFYLSEPIDFSSCIFKFTLMFHRQPHCLILCIEKELEQQGKVASS